MYDKQIYDLTAQDINQYPVWFFPMDETVEDELTVRPVIGACLEGDFQVIVRTTFTDSKALQYIGYIYWSTPKVIGHIMPVMFTGVEECITFWSGIRQPSWSVYSASQQRLKDAFPIGYESDATVGLPSLTGTLKGLYFSNNNNVQYI